MTKASDLSMHDLRAPLANAMGFLEELTIIQQSAVARLRSVQPDEGLRDGDLAEVAAGVDGEMSVCLDAIRRSLEQLDSMLDTD